jgi:hypothetical protein
MNDTRVDEIVDGELRGDDHARVKAELDADERLLWLGRPTPLSAPLGRGTATIATIDAVAWIIGIACVASSVSGGWRLDNAMAAAAPALFIGGFLSVALLLFFLCRRSERTRLRGTLYALTDRRAIIWRPSGRTGGVEVHSVARGGVKRVHRVEYPDGSGDVIFQQPTEGEVHWPPTGFEKVPEVVRVERLVREALLSDGRT